MFDNMGEGKPNRSIHGGAIMAFVLILVVMGVAVLALRNWSEPQLRATMERSVTPVSDFEVGEVNPTIMLTEVDNFQETRVDILCVDGRTLYIVRTRGNTTPVAVAAVGRHPGHCGIE